jgi:hypothetical protein
MPEGLTQPTGNRPALEKAAWWSIGYTGLTIPNRNFSVNQIIHLRLLRGSPF